MEKAFQRQERKQDDGFNNSLTCENCPFKSLCIVSSLWDFLGVNCLMFRSDLTLNCAGVIFPNTLSFVLPNITVIFMCAQWHNTYVWDETPMTRSSCMAMGRLLSLPRFLFSAFEDCGDQKRMCNQQSLAYVHLCGLILGSRLQGCVSFCTFELGSTLCWP